METTVRANYLIGTTKPTSSFFGLLTACEDIAPAHDPDSNFIQLAALRITGWTPWPAGRYGSGMPRRNVYDPLLPTKEPRWYVVRNMHRALLESRLLPPGVDLKRAFVVAMLEWIDAGWEFGEFSSTAGTFFCTRGPNGAWCASSRAIRASNIGTGPRTWR
jgi:hypothetical protein